MAAAPGLRPLLLPPSAPAILVAAVWRGESLRGADEAGLAGAMELARRNHVAGALARVYPAHFAAELAAVEAANAAMRRTLDAAARRLHCAGLQPVLVKFDNNADAEYSNVDVVTGDAGFAGAQRAMAGWTVRTSRHPLEPDKLLLHPESDPAVHLHRHLSWFGVTVITHERLLAAATEGVAGLRVPSRDAALRSHIAHACFQNLGSDLAELLTLRALMDPQNVAAAHAAAVEEGWGRSFAAAVTALRAAMQRLDTGLQVRLPVMLPLRAATGAGVEHALGAARRGDAGTALRELALRAPLVAAKRRRARRESGPLDHAVLLGVSGPDGVGKTSVAGAIVDAVSARRGAAVCIHPYGCVFCRTFGRAQDSGRVASTAQRHSRAVTALHTLHAGLDALEMSLRTRLARARAQRGARRIERRTGMPAVAMVVTDRSPLDGLVKHAPRIAAPALAWFSRLARHYDRVVCLDAPATTLAERDADHSETVLAGRRAMFADWVGRLPGTVVVTVEGRRPEEIAAAMATSVLGPQSD